MVKGYLTCAKCGARMVRGGYGFDCPICDLGGEYAALTAIDEEERAAEVRAAQFMEYLGKGGN